MPGAQSGASSSQTGPSNTTSETTATLQADLDATNAEIEQLRALLTAKDTPIPGTPTSDRLADVLEALTEHLTRTDSPATPAKSAKIPDPPLLTDGKDPTFDNWKIQIVSKLEVNADHFATEQACMTYVFSHTGGDAQNCWKDGYSPAIVAIHGCRL